MWRDMRRVSWDRSLGLIFIFVLFRLNYNIRHFLYKINHISSNIWHAVMNELINSSWPKNAKTKSAAWITLGLMHPNFFYLSHFPNYVIFQSAYIECGRKLYSNPRAFGIVLVPECWVASPIRLSSLVNTNKLQFIVLSVYMIVLFMYVICWK